MNVIIPGTFDMFHNGHRELIRYGSMIGRVYIVINGDDICAKYGKQCKDNELERLKNVNTYLNSKGICAIVELIKHDTDTIDIAKSISPCFWLTGRDWDLDSTSERNDVPITFWEDNNIHLIYKDRVPNLSSTKLRLSK